MRRIGRMGATALASLSLAGLPVTPVAAAEIVSVRVGRHPDVTRVVVDLAQPASYALSYDAAHGLTVTLDADGAAHMALPAKVDGVGMVKNVRIVSAAEIDVALTSAVEVSRAFTLDPDEYGGQRIVIDLKAAPPAAEAPAPEAAAPEPPAPEPAVMASAEEAPDPFGAGSEVFGEKTFTAAPAEGGIFDGLSVDGYVEAEGRAFTQGSRDPGPNNQTASVAAEPSLTYAWNGGRQAITFTPFGRVDANDNERSHVDIRELKWVGAFDRVELRLGIDKVFWGVTESVHLVDILNQDDQLEDIDGEDKLGQPMASVSVDSGFGVLSAYVMTYFRERKFAGIDGRPRGPLPIDADHPQYGSGSDKWHVDWAARWSHAFGPFDVAVSHFHGLNRDPVFVPGVDGSGAPALIPRYNLIDQTGLELQATIGPLLLKGEAIRRAQPGENQVAAVAGFEYTAYNVIGGASDVGFLMEYLWDQRGPNPDNPFENDLFAALRWTANDVPGTTLLAGAIFDLDTAAKFVNIEASRRFGSHWKVSLDARLLFTVPPTDPLYPFADDDFIQLKLQRYF